MPDDSAIDVLLIDDDFGVPDSTFAAKYGELERRDRPYRFHYETAADESGYSVRAAVDSVRRISGLAAVLLDIKFGPEDDRLGLEMLEEIRRHFPLLPIIMLTSLDRDIDALERAMEMGANEYLVKSPPLAELEKVLRIYTEPGAEEAEQAIWGNSSAVRRVRAQIARVAAGGSVSVLITGETGTGKELVARAIHRFGPRRNKAFVAKNCSHSDTQLLEAELFGQEKGRFTGAETAAGLVEQASGGVLFLDEIGDMPIALQGKLLRVLETKTYRPVGASTERQADFQLVTATNRDLGKLVEKRQFARDLFYRIQVVQIHAPLLRERPEDIPLLADLFLRRFLRRIPAIYPAERFTNQALQTLASPSYDWPGNARELRNVVECCATMARSSEIDVPDLPSQFSRGYAGQGSRPDSDSRSALRDSSVANNFHNPVIPPDGFNLPLWLARQELGAIQNTLQTCNGNKAKMMKLLYPGQPAHYFYRIIYNAVRRASEVIDEFPELKQDYEKELATRTRQKSQSSSDEQTL
jgi:DNA-binding NtrC family response regulator